MGMQSNILVNYFNSRKKFKTINSNGILNVINTEDKLSFIRKAEVMLNKAEESGEILFLYRGENKQLFYKKTGCEYIPYVNIEPYFDRFFVIGSKAKSYYTQLNPKFKVLKQFDHIENTKYIFKTLNTLSAKSDNYSVLNYFRNPSNKSKFYKKIKDIDDTNHRIIVENFYISYIHTISSNPIDMRAYSVMISATKKYQKAKEYSDNGYIIGFWIRRPIINQAIDYQNLNECKTIIDKYKLQMLNIIHTPQSFEVTIFSAIFPHNILWVYDIEKQTYIINPYLFETKLENLIINGISVNQTYFDESIKDIYVRSIWRSGTSLLFEEVQDN